MKFFILTLLTITLLPLTAKAEMTQSNVDQFNEDYMAAFETCNDAAVNTFIDNHYADTYIMVLQTPNGQMRQANKEQLKLIASQGIQMMNEINGPGGNCRPDMTVDNIQVNGNSGIMQTTQREELTMPQNGKMVGVRANTTCRHQIVENGNSVMLQKSECRLYQD